MIKMSFIDSLTPKDTEEIKPDLFIQKTKKGYRQVHPVAWKGKWRTKEQLAMVFSIRTIATIAVICFLAWSYLHDQGALREFYIEVQSNPVEFCNSVLQDLNQNTRLGIGDDDFIKQLDTSSIQGNP